MRNLWVVPLCLAAAACSGGEGENKAAAAETPDTLPAGSWKTDFEVKSFRSADQTTPALKAKPGDKEEARGCVAANERSKPSPGLFAGAGYQCTYANSYFRGGMINASMTCTRPELKGQINMTVTGSFDADSFDVTVDEASYLPGPGDFVMSRKVKGKVTPGACEPVAAPAGAAPAGGKAKAGG
ncbi:MAG: DUF3617 family protein [Alphaproteobacteria bacterium]|nr:DUF3617 family protein [Alphaproteobacteria bacterium]MBV9370047.1 DUF3617 family protein [Alphaproteobacteria bacterium]